MSKHRICIVGNMITLPESPDHAGIIQALDKLKEWNDIEDYFIADVNKNFSLSVEYMVELILAFKPTLIIHGMTDSLSRELPRKIVQAIPVGTTKPIQVMSMWDYRPQNMNYDGLWQTWKMSGQYLDLVTLSNKNQIDWWKDEFKTKVEYWPHGCVVQGAQYDPVYEKDTVFLGSRNLSAPYGERVKLLDEIIRHTPVEWINEAGGDSDPARRVVWQNIGKIYYSAKTALDISHFWDAEGYASGRYFYSAGLGACSISKRFPGCEELFPEGTKIYFDTPEEAVDKIKFYVANEKERNEVKKKGKEWANQHHNYVVRFRELFKMLNL